MKVTRAGEGQHRPHGWAPNRNPRLFRLFSGDLAVYCLKKLSLGQREKTFFSSVRFALSPALLDDVHGWAQTTLGEPRCRPKNTSACTAAHLAKITSPAQMQECSPPLTNGRKNSKASILDIGSKLKPPARSSPPPALRMTLCRGEGNRGRLHDHSRG